MYEAITYTQSDGKGSENYCCNGKCLPFPAEMYNKCKINIDKRINTYSHFGHLLHAKSLFM